MSSRDRRRRFQAKQPWQPSRRARTWSLFPAILVARLTACWQAVKKGEISEARIDRERAEDSAREGVCRPQSRTASSISRRCRMKWRGRTNVALCRKRCRSRVTFRDGYEQADSAAGAGDGHCCSAASRIVAVIFSDRPRGSDGGRAFASELRQRAPGAGLFCRSQ